MFKGCEGIRGCVHREYYFISTVLIECVCVLCEFQFVGFLQAHLIFGKFHKLVTLRKRNEFYHFEYYLVNVGIFSKTGPGFLLGNVYFSEYILYKKNNYVLSLKLYEFVN